MTGKKLSLYSAASDVERMIFAIENAENLDEQVVSDFTDLRTNLQDPVDRCLNRLSMLDVLIDGAKKTVARAKEDLDKLETAKESLERYVFAVVKSVSFPLKSDRGEFGTKFGRGKVQLSVPVIESKAYTNVLASDSLAVDIPQKFLDHVQFYRIRKDEVAKALNAGEKLPFATLVKEENLKWVMKTLLS